MSERRAFIVDLNKCTGCHACETACQIANGVSGELRWRRVRTFNELHVHGVEVVHLSLACNHCAAPPCMDGCPARAIYRDAATGAVLIDQDKCIGCRYCAWVCPYGALRFDEGRAVTVKCDFCVDRQRAGLSPACVDSCPTGALSWDSLPAALLVASAPGMAEAGTEPSIRIVPLDPRRRAPRQTEPPAAPPWRALSGRTVPQITLAREWTLAIFTLVLSALVAVFLASRLAGAAHGAAVPLGAAAGRAAGASAPARTAGPPGGLLPGPALLLAVGAGGLLLSASHLGRKTRAWRAALHADRSWLSREIALFVAFLALASSTLFLESASSAAGRPPATAAAHLSALARALGGAPTAHALGWLAAALGASALISAGRVYRAAIVRGAGSLHSAHLLLTGSLLAAAWAAGVLSQGGGHTAAWVATGVATALAGLKGTLYVLRKSKRRRMGLPVRGWTAALRLGLLAAGAAALWWGPPVAAAIAALLTAELVDRAEYYDEMEIPTPESLMLEELGARVGRGPE
jgi:anaerobic dimethyl sulfoxide reductase subunit B (iron-sulfur subunit)